MMNFLLLAATVAIGQTPERFTFGPHYTDGLAGLSIYRSTTESLQLCVGWTSPDGVRHQGYRDLVAAQVHFDEAAPDDSYHRIWWKVDGTTVTYEWCRLSKTCAGGRLSTTGPIVVRLLLLPGWPGSKPEFLPDILHGRPSLISGDLDVSLNVNYSRLTTIDVPSPRTSIWEDSYAITEEKPLTFSVGYTSVLDPKIIEDNLFLARDKYEGRRLWAEGDWGDFLSPIENQLGNSKVYSPDTGRLAHIVSRGWCLPDGQVLFCWDSFFNGLLSSLEDPVNAKNTIRAILAAATPDGFVPNFAGRGWGRSDDRSQPPVGSYCVWKMHQRNPDKAFLAEAYPKLLKWHRWWFGHKGGSKANRDGNGDGLLEWGSAHGVLQDAKYESGLDDSPMFDDGKMDGPNMTTDATDLNALWAMDAEYLARIADQLGKTKEASQLRKEREDMRQRMNAKLWNDQIGAYCYRYWVPRPEVEALEPAKVFRSEGKPGFSAEYFHGRDLKGTPAKRQDAKIDFAWSKEPLPGFGQTNFSTLWTADFMPPKSGSYTFEAISDDGCRLYVDNRKVIDGWSVHPPVKYESPKLRFKAGEAHKIRFEYFQAEGGASVSLDVKRLVEEKPGAVFSSRLSPLNFYPLIVDSPSAKQARRTLDLFFRPDRFGGQYVCPSISKNDPAFPAQGYWRGTIWGPTSYLTYQGLRRYATDAEMTDYAQKSVALFMKNWNADGSCHENFNAMTGEGRSDPHYTWGALLCLIGLEQLCDIDADGRVLLNGASGRHIKIHNLQMRGRTFDVIVEPKQATLRENGRVVAVARGKVERIRL